MAKIPQSKTAKRYGVCNKTIIRWRQNPKLGFPAGYLINGRWYDDEVELDAFDRANAATEMRAA
jgi:hypothetical protein